MQLKKFTKFIKCPYCGRITSTQEYCWYPVKKERYRNSSNCRKFCVCNECYDIVEIIPLGYTICDKDVIITYKLEDRVKGAEPKAQSYWRLLCN